jgi:hypothetical protein
MKFTHHYGGSSLDEVNWNNRLFADGQSLAITNGAFTYIMPGYSVQSVQVTREDIGVTLIGDSNRRSQRGSSYMDIHLRSRGPLKACSAYEVEAIFKNANDLSVDDLLKLIYERMEQRDSNDEKRPLETAHMTE